MPEAEAGWPGQLPGRAARLREASKPGGNSFQSPQRPRGRREEYAGGTLLKSGNDIFPENLSLAMALLGDDPGAIVLEVAMFAAASLFGVVSAPKPLSTATRQARPSVVALIWGLKFVLYDVWTSSTLVLLPHHHRCAAGCLPQTLQRECRPLSRLQNATHLRSHWSHDASSHGAPSCDVVVFSRECSSSASLINDV